MIFRLTKRLNIKLKTGALETLPLHENPLLDWSAHLFPVRRKQFILLSNTKSLLSTVLPGQGITSEARFLEVAFAGIRQCMEVNGFGSNFRTAFPANSDSVRFAKALNRTVTGSINELVRVAELWLAEGEMPLAEVDDGLNDMLLSALAASRSHGYGKPSEAFRAMMHEARSDADPRDEK